MHPENLEGTRVIVGSINIGYDIYPALPGIELTTCFVPSARRFHKATVTDESCSYNDLDGPLRICDSGLFAF